MDANTVIKVLDDLVKINNDRIEGYEKAIENLTNNNGDADLLQLFNDFIAESRKNKAELLSVSQQYGTDVVNETTVPGEIYRFWMDLKATFSGDKRLAMLEACEYGEDAAQKAYKEALDKNQELPVHVIQLIKTQKTQLRESHDRVKRLRDLEKIAD